MHAALANVTGDHALLMFFTQLGMSKNPLHQFLSLCLLTGNLDCLRDFTHLWSTFPAVLPAVNYPMLCLSHFCDQLYLHCGIDSNPSYQDGVGVVLGYLTSVPCLFGNLFSQNRWRLFRIHSYN